MNLIQTLEQEEIARLGKTIPDFAPGDTVVVSVKVVEGTRKRLQAYEGVVIAKRNRGLNSAFIVRKISSGEGVERSFQTYSPLGTYQGKAGTEKDRNRRRISRNGTDTGRLQPSREAAFSLLEIVHLSSARPIPALSSLPNFDPRQVPVIGVDSHLPAIVPAEFTRI